MRAISARAKRIASFPPSRHGRPTPIASHGPTCPSSSSLLDEFAEHCHQRDLSRAMKAMHAMQRQGIWADAITYSELVKCCVARGAVEEGKSVHKHVFSCGYQPKTYLLNVLLNMYVRFNLLEDAEGLFDEMPDRNVVSWTTLISAYVSKGMNNRALEFLILMLRGGVQPNMYTYSSVLRACADLGMLRQLHSGIIKVGMESDVFVRSALIDNYSKQGELQDALDVFNEMVTKDLGVWNSIIGAFAQNSNGDKALEMYKCMKRAGFAPDQATLTSVLRASTALALLEVGRQVHVHVLKFDRDLILNNALLDMYCKCGGLEGANSVFSRMAERDVISWSTMIAGLAQNGCSLEAMRLFEQMKHSGTEPNYITIVGVLFACSHAGLVEDGLHYFRSMKRSFGIDPGREHYGCMVDLLGRAGKLDEAVKLINEMECEPDAVTWRTLLSACRVHRNSDLAIYAAKQVVKLDPDDAGTYILLSNIYANNQRWEEVTEVRRSMRVRGIAKEPGCSWIEVNKKIHAFILGDDSHPHIDGINRHLNQTVQRLMSIGYVPDTNFVLQDLEDEQREASLQYHSEKLAIAYGIMSLPREKTIMIRKNLRICGDCHTFTKLLAKMEQRIIVIRDPVRYHHFTDGACSCGDFW
ncbi:pentatricopeptide repeat-containing protein At2g03880, mitochondrial [Rhodamnia argentea]|uniref:Pentatricopeptide repeat-containing protein At2g03880, mitochondrial n=1 Tax=Rhodamnia argentea TaxID=178133 RepID=A0A8B8QAG6_9MYRT|nr:pentatricopeptide repeat-containing protein At2g03880, mitochondrial [Rhodamnia argentea]XP_048130411.1 pentatricopeptide repeat-containing protein At2g03880, mitochondrial [Rhodamnia argentea]XP_048130412.1 pentatricopeptide repeat-containing protein At2g03880, mitochondrial [Rhodamnia argentea]